MKALIWILTITLGTFLNAIIGYATGIQAGAILLYLVECYIARKLCKKWDEKKENKQQESNIE